MQVVGWTSEIKGNFVFFDLKLFESLKERKIDQNQFQLKIIVIEI